LDYVPSGFDEYSFYIFTEKIQINQEIFLCNLTQVSPISLIFFSGHVQFTSPRTILIDNWILLHCSDSDWIAIRDLKINFDKHLSLCFNDIEKYLRDWINYSNISFPLLATINVILKSDKMYNLFTHFSHEKVN